MTDRTIKTIVGMEPMREGEYQSSFSVGFGAGHNRGIVSRIQSREDNYGDHSIGWFDIYVGDRIVVSMNQRCVAEVYYDD